MVRLLQPVVPAHRRDEWREEWESELWHHLAFARRRSGPGAALELAWRLAGALPHALWIRLALGARRDQVFALVVPRGMVILAAGIAIGLVAAFGATRLVRSLPPCRLAALPPCDPHNATPARPALSGAASS